jgi:hypothetical protein
MIRTAAADGKRTKINMEDGVEITFDVGGKTKDTTQNPIST